MLDMKYFSFQLKKIISNTLQNVCVLKLSQLPTKIRDILQINKSHTDNWDLQKLPPLNNLTKGTNQHHSFLNPQQA